MIKYNWADAAPLASRAISLVLLLLLSALAQVRAQSGSERIILATTDLNRDNRPDTVEAISPRPGYFIPNDIVWGRDSTAVEKRTTVKMPTAWRRLEVSVSVVDVDRDTSADLLVVLRGRVDVSGRDRDTVRPLVIFGQRGLDTLDEINLASVNRGFQSSPFFAMDLRFGTDLVSKAKRDFSGSVSFRLLPVDRSDSDTSSGPLIDSGHFLIVAYPNPASTALSLAVEAESGEFHCRLVSVNGTLYGSVQVRMVEGRGAASSEIPVVEVPSGVYVVQLVHNGRVVAEYPCVIVH